jgi:HSP20 family protein
MFTPSLWKFRRVPDVIPKMVRLQREMNQLFSTAEQRTPQSYPAVNIWENTESALVTAGLPGMEADKIDIEINGDILTLSGVGTAEILNEGETYLRQERDRPNFKRKIQLSFPVDPKRVEARYEKGILRITLHRLEESKPKKIKIN